MFISLATIDQDNPLKIPEWIKTDAGWCSSYQILDYDFAKGLEHLIKINLIVIPHGTNFAKSGYTVT